MSGVVSAVQITNAGSSGTNGIGSAATGTTIGFGSAPANGIAAQAYPIVGGKLSGLTITQAGSGFVFPPVLLIDAPPQGGIQATATCTISGGAINAVTLQNAGAGYTATPNVWVLPQFLLPVQAGAPINPTPPANAIPPGNVAAVQGTATSPPFIPGAQWAAAIPNSNGALITANGLTGSGTLTGAVVMQYGAGYTGTTIPTISFSGGGLAGGVAATAVMSLSVISLGTAGTPGAGYTVGAPWVSDTGVLMSAPSAQTDFCNGTFQPRPARGRIAATTGFTGTPALVEDTGFGIQTVPNIGVTQFGAAITTGSTTTAVCGGVFDVSLLQPGVED
jgi:hypothetical protein